MQGSLEREVCILFVSEIGTPLAAISRNSDK